MKPEDEQRQSSFFQSAEWYDLGVNWGARLERELPVLRDVMGQPGELGLLDAGCGTGHQAIALAQAGYRVTGLDASEDMLRIAAGRAREAGADVRWALSTYETLAESLPQPFDGLYCIGNSLAAAGTAAATEQAIRNFAAVLRPGGRLFLQVINFDAMRAEPINIRGPRARTVDGIEYVSYRHFRFEADRAVVTNVTLWKDKTWRHRTHQGQLHPVSRDELDRWLTAANMRIDALYSDYQRTAYDPNRPDDLIVVATRQ